MLQQYNRDIQSTDRVKIDRLYPQLSDLKESGNPSEDSSTVFGLFNPNTYNIKSMGGYDTSGSSRSVHILKNRDGESDVIGVFDFIGHCGYFKEKNKNQQTELNYGE